MEQTPSPIEQAEAALSDAIRGTAVWTDSCEQAAAHLAELLGRSGASRGAIRRRLCRLGVTRGGASELASEAIRTLGDREKAREDAKFAGASPVCPHCIEPVGPLDHFCPKCGDPVSGRASMDPMSQICTVGFAYRQALEKPGKMALVGVWLLLAPSFLYLLYCLHLGLRTVGAFGPQSRWEHVESDGFIVDLVKLGLTLGLTVLNAAILWKVTARYVRSRRKRAE